eukprot:TRINITY_DN16803_c0_g1_i1.p1 TRINITY_DN16803_c0_g1~~TRINITY_DN16803_c0_g1_i1.p1  ORF type:complete len:326 (+),score=55.58 TRINITY_DN16803_c0_g1_i1:49-978(+)
MNELRMERWDAGKAVRTHKVPFETEGDWNERVVQVTNSVRHLYETPYLRYFQRHQFALSVFDANRMEGTLSLHLKEGETMLKILSFIREDGGDGPEPWDAEGGRHKNSKSSDSQLRQFVRAVNHLCLDNVNSCLTPQLILDTYRIMMNGAHDGENPLPLRFRGAKEEVCAGFHQFIPGSAVAFAIQGLCASYEEKRSNGEHPIQLASYLFYEMVTIHPFINGNGRLSRLFLSWSLMRDGLPFPVSFSSGHKKRRQHYMHAIQTARRKENPNRGELNVILTLSVERVVDNYLENLRLIPVEFEDDPAGGQ